jgi:hypothetical protein
MAMVRTVALLLSLLAAPVTSEKVDVGAQGVIDLRTFECRDINRSTIVQRVCYDAAQGNLLVAVKSTYHRYCGVPAETYAAFMTAPSMGLFFQRTIQTAASGDRYHCRERHSTEVQSGR